MKTRVFTSQIIIALIALTSVAAALRWSVFLPRSLLEKSLEAQVSDVIAAFVADTSPVLKLRWEDFRRLRSDPRLTDPKVALPRSDLQSATFLAIYRYAMKCQGPLPIKASDTALAKLLLWTRYACGEALTLSGDFFLKPPLMHPSGQSYASLYLHSKSSHGSLRSDELESLKSLTHVMELASLPPPIKLTNTERVASAFTLDQWEMIQYRALLAYGPRYTLIAEGGENGLQYSIYATETFKQWVAETYLMMDKAGGSGYYRGNTRWAFAQEKLARDRNIAAVVGAVGALVLLAQIIWLLLRLRRLRNEELKRRSFSLQLLTHEIRTPASALRLSLNSLQAAYDHLPDAAQINLLEAMAAEARMGRVLHASQAYLQSAESTLSMQLGPCDDFETFVEELLQDYKEMIVIENPGHTPHLRFDKHWLGFCLRNLVENAIRHGRPPITLRWRADRDHFYVEVSDEGQFKVRDYQRFSKPFAKQVQSNGLGLGLSIVKRILEVMGGQLDFRPKPTTFTLKLKKGGT